MSQRLCHDCSAKHEGDSRDHHSYCKRTDCLVKHRKPLGQKQPAELTGRELSMLGTLVTGTNGSDDYMKPLKGPLTYESLTTAQLAIIKKEPPKQEYV